MDNLKYWNNPGWYEVTLKIKVKATVPDFDNAEEAQIIAEGMVLNAIDDLGYGDCIKNDPETLSVSKGTK